MSERLSEAMRRKMSGGHLLCADRSGAKKASSIEGNPADGCKMAGIIIVKMIETLH